MKACLRVAHMTAKCLSTLIDRPRSLFIVTTLNTGIQTSILWSCRRGFTLIELLIVIAIGAMLMGMLSAMLSLAQRQARFANTKALMAQVDQAIRMFRTEMRIYPWQSDLGTAPAEPAAWGNDLAWRLAWKPPASGSGTPGDPDRITYMRNFQSDLAAVQGAFRFVNGCNVPPSGDGSEGTHAFRIETQTATSRTNLLVGTGSIHQSLTSINNYATRWIPGTPVNGNDCTGDALALTQMAAEVTTLAYTAGQMPTQAPTGIDPALPADKALHPEEDERYPSMTISKASTIPYRYFPYNKAGFYGDDSRGPVLTSATAKAHGWRGSYLAEALNDGSNGGHRDVDAGGDAIVDAWGHPLIYVCTVRPGVRGYMPGLTTSILSGTREERYGMGPQGRAATSSLDSDIRTAAAGPYVYEFELWSAGPDGIFAGARNDPGNRDNLSIVDYRRGLQ